MRGGARCWYCAARRGSGRPHFWNTSAVMPKAAGFFTPSGWSPRWSFPCGPSPVVCAVARTGWSGCRRPSVRRSRPPLAWLGRPAGSFFRRPGPAESAVGRLPTNSRFSVLIDDAQWFDQLVRAGARVRGAAPAGGVGRPSSSRSVRPSELDQLAGLPELRLEGLSEAHAERCSRRSSAGRLDERVRDRIVAETHGNPLALLELPRGLSPAELAGGFGIPAVLPLPSRIEESFRRESSRSPPQTRGCCLSPRPSRSAIRRCCGVRPSSSASSGAAAAGGRRQDLITLGARVIFRHPLLRSAIYRAASPTTAGACIGRWPRPPIPTSILIAAPGIGPGDAAPDEDVAAELERSADRARARGGLAAAAAFLERAAS